MPVRANVHAFSSVVEPLRWASVKRGLSYIRVEMGTANVGPDGMNGW